jgi:hypothetical protein
VRPLLAALALAAALLAPAAPWGTSAQAQRDAGIDIRLPARELLAVEGPLVSLVGVIGDRQTQDLLRHGFPVRLHYRVELWSVGGWFNDLKATTEWDVVVRYDPLDRRFEVARLVGDRVTPLGEFAEYADAQQAAERPFRAPIELPRRGRRSYYNVVVDVETLSLSDLDEVERWLRGELRPAVRLQKSPGTALTRGARLLVARMLGAETRHYERRSGTFRP